MLFTNGATVVLHLLGWTFSPNIRKQIVKKRENLLSIILKGFTSVIQTIKICVFFNLILIFLPQLELISLQFQLVCIIIAASLLVGIYIRGVWVRISWGTGTGVGGKRMNRWPSQPRHWSKNCYRRMGVAVWRAFALPIHTPVPSLTLGTCTVGGTP